MAEMKPIEKYLEELIEPSLKALRLEGAPGYKASGLLWEELGRLIAGETAGGMIGREADYIQLADCLHKGRKLWNTRHVSRFGSALLERTISLGWMLDDIQSADQIERELIAALRHGHDRPSEASQLLDLLEFRTAGPIRSIPEGCYQYQLQPALVEMLLQEAAYDRARISLRALIQRGASIEALKARAAKTDLPAEARTKVLNEALAAEKLLRLSWEDSQ